MRTNRLGLDICNLCMRPNRLGLDIYILRMRTNRLGLDICILRICTNRSGLDIYILRIRTKRLGLDIGILCKRTNRLGLNIYILCMCTKYLVWASFLRMHKKGFVWINVFFTSAQKEKVGFGHLYFAQCACVQKEKKSNACHIFCYLFILKICYAHLALSLDVFEQKV